MCPFLSTKQSKSCSCIFFIQLWQFKTGFTVNVKYDFSIEVVQQVIFSDNQIIQAYDLFNFSMTVGPYKEKLITLRNINTSIG